jgi:uncharacterized repeat protein (TIGR03803 family)
MHASQCRRLRLSTGSPHIAHAISITPSGNENVLHSFGNGADGIDPIGSLIAVKGTLYGTTSEGGASTCSFGCGTVFSITTSGAENVVYSFGS